jgi:hypothetical protein
MMSPLVSEAEEMAWATYNAIWIWHVEFDGTMCMVTLG